MFVNKLIVPSYQQGLARVLIDEKVPIRIAGSGWSEIPRFAPHAIGPVRTREELAFFLGSASVLVHVWPDQRVHAIDFAGRTVIRPARTRDRFVRDVRQILQIRTPSVAARNSASAPLISPGFLRQILAGAR